MVTQTRLSDPRGRDRYGSANDGRRRLGPPLPSLGLTGFALGFALRDAVSNLLSGALIMLDRPFADGDRISVTRVTSNDRRRELSAIRCSRDPAGPSCRTVRCSPTPSPPSAAQLPTDPRRTRLLTNGEGPEDSVDRRKKAAHHRYFLKPARPLGAKSMTRISSTPNSTSRQASSSRKYSWKPIKRKAANSEPQSVPRPPT
jgi:hypothetical protein